VSGEQLANSKQPESAVTVCCLLFAVYGLLFADCCLLSAVYFLDIV
jgi:hypothetical protein